MYPNLRVWIRRSVYSRADMRPFALHGFGNNLWPARRTAGRLSSHGAIRKVSSHGKYPWRLVWVPYGLLSTFPLTSSALAVHHLVRGREDDARGCAFFAVTGFLSLPFSLVILLSMPYTLLMDEERRQIPDWVQKTWGKGTTRCFFQTRVEGRGHLLDIKGNTAVYVSNHASWLDIYVLFWVDPIALKIVARKEIFLIPLCGWVM